VEAACSRLKVEKWMSVTQRREVDRWRGREVVVKQRFGVGRRVQSRFRCVRGLG